MVSHCARPTKAGSSGLSRLSGWSGWSDRKFIKKNQTDQKDQPTRQTNPGALREHRRSSVSIPSSVPRARRTYGFSLSAARVIHYFIFKGSLVDPRLRASNEHILIVRVPRAGGQPGYPIPFPSSPAPRNNAQRLSCRRRLGPNRNTRSAHGSHVRAGSIP